MAGQDYPVYLGPGQTKTLQVSGDFIYCKFVDRPVMVWVDDQRVKMEAGDNYRPGQRFASFTVENPDRKNPVSIVLTAGKGSFTRQIVQGEIKAEPVLRGADGTTRADTRQAITLALMPQTLKETVYSRGDLINTAEAVTSGYPHGLYRMGARVELAIPPTSGGGTVELYQYTQELELVKQHTVSIDNGANHFAHWPGIGYVYQDSGNIYRANAATDDSLLAQVTEGPMVVNPSTNELWVVPRLGGDVVIVGTDYKTTKAGFEAAADAIDIDQRTGYLIARDAGVMTVSDTNGETVETWNEYQDTSDLESGFVVNGWRYWAWNNGQERVEKHAFQDYTTKPEILAQPPGCELENALNNNRSAPQVAAEITAEGLADGVSVTGELIRAALEWRYGLRIGDGYLDHVYRMERSRSETGQAVAPIDTGTNTFQRMEIADDFGFMMPGRITIVIDNELPTEGPL